MAKGDRFTYDPEAMARVLARNAAENAKRAAAAAADTDAQRGSSPPASTPAPVVSKPITKPIATEKKAAVASSAPASKPLAWIAPDKVKQTRGRKRKPKNPRSGSQARKKKFMVTTAYDEAEFAMIEEAASRAGLTRASYQRVQSLAKPTTRSTRRAPIEKELLGKVLLQLGYISRNVNQLTMVVHTGRVLEGSIRAALQDLKDMRPLLLEALGRDPRL